MRGVFLALFLASPLMAGQASSISPGVKFVSHFNEGAGATTYDSVQGLSGAISGGAWVSGLWGSAYYFHTGANIIFQDNAAFNPASEITINCWINPIASGSGGNARLVSKDDVSLNREYLFTYDTNSGLTWYVFRSGGAVAVTAPANTAPVGKWTMVTATCDSRPVCSIYANGVWKKSGNASGNLPSKNAAVYMGKCQNVTTDNYTGTIESCSIYDVALSTGQVMNLYLENIGRHSDD